ncbi:SAS complex subunit [Didymosphaeria variabile]|uniref:SAS complex subunit n=1 Tax=Didymosphaeria variabile TaxID=1932322 RepID=A0A9W8XD20_9PLEO|nr:SAS complex subunit [Didymosphaeria variabile]KAJ4347173.1 SAS complex subunit [Didymosphaeria variabile]
MSIVSTADFVSSSNSELQLDRSNAEFGLLYPLEDSTSIMAQADNDESIHFKASWVLAICTRSSGQGGAALKESTAGCIQLEEDATTVEALLMEIYGVQNTNTGSVFTTFALEPTIKKEATMNTLLSLFVAADKYGLDTIKRRAACAFLDRLPFLHDAGLIMDLANFALDDIPERDCGLRASIIRYVQARLPAILRSPEAEEELMQNAIVCLAVLRSFSKMIEEGALTVGTKSSSGLLTPPASPIKRRKFA